MTTTTTNAQEKRSTVARRTAGGSGSTWKSAIVAVSLSGVLMGWAILGRIDSTADAEIATVNATIQTITSADTSVQASAVNNASGSRITLPAMPQRPVFQQPVTRSRGS